LVGEKWRNLTDEERQVYDQMAVEDALRLKELREQMNAKEQEAARLAKVPPPAKPAKKKSKKNPKSKSAQADQSKEANNALATSAESINSSGNDGAGSVMAMNDILKGMSNSGTPLEQGSPANTLNPLSTYGQTSSGSFLAPLPLVSKQDHLQFSQMKYGAQHKSNQPSSYSSLLPHDHPYGHYSAELARSQSAYAMQRPGAQGASLNDPRHAVSVGSHVSSQQRLSQALSAAHAQQGYPSYSQYQATLGGAHPSVANVQAYQYYGQMQPQVSVQQLTTAQQQQQASQAQQQLKSQQQQQQQQKQQQPSLSVSNHGVYGYSQSSPTTSAHAHYPNSVSDPSSTLSSTHSLHFAQSAQNNSAQSGQGSSTQSPQFQQAQGDQFAKYPYMQPQSQGSTDQAQYRHHPQQYYGHVPSPSTSAPSSLEIYQPSESK
jgi:hypothetical protein